MNATDGGSRTGFTVNTDVMDQKARDVADLVRRIQDALADLDRRMGVLFQTWQGDGSSAYRTVHTDWQTDYKSLNESLRAIGQNLATTSATYVKADVDNTPA
jgi:WXG100 family type VII secretion target